MIQTTAKVSGMACSMCEAHINDAVRRGGCEKSHIKSLEGTNDHSF